MEPDFGRDATVATVLIAAIVALATGSAVLGVGVLGLAAMVFGAVALIRARSGARSRGAAPHRSRLTGPQSH